MVQLIARIMFSNNISHGYDYKPIIVNKDDVSSVSPDGTGLYTLIMNTGERFTINMTFNDIKKALEK